MKGIWRGCWGKWENWGVVRGDRLSVRIDQCRRTLIINFAVVRPIRGSIWFATKILIANENAIRHANVPKIIVMFNHWQP